MSALVTGNIYQMTVIGSDAFGFFENVRHYVVSALTGGGETEEDFLAKWRTEMNATYPAVFCQTLAIQEYHLQKITAAGVPLTDALVAINNTPVAGLLTGDQMPSFTAAVISLRTGTAGRRNRGRFYVWPADEDQNTSTGVLEGTYITALQPLANFLIGPITVGTLPNTATLTPICLSKKFSTYLPLTGQIVREAWGTQRHRKLGRGM